MTVLPDGRTPVRSLRRTDYGGTQSNDAPGVGHPPSRDRDIASTFLTQIVHHSTSTVYAGGDVAEQYKKQQRTEHQIPESAAAGRNGLLLDLVLGPRRRSRLPLHVARSIGAATLQRNNVVDHVALACP